MIKKNKKLKRNLASIIIRNLTLQTKNRKHLYQIMDLILPHNKISILRIITKMTTINIIRKRIIVLTVMVAMTMKVINLKLQKFLFKRMYLINKFPKSLTKKGISAKFQRIVGKKRKEKLIKKGS